MTKQLLSCLIITADVTGDRLVLRTFWYTGCNRKWIHSVWSPHPSLWCCSSPSSSTIR